MNKIKERNSNYELMRIISMCMIILWHIILHGHVIENCVSGSAKVISELLLFFIIVHVNSFVLVTGYFNSDKDFKQSKIWSLINSCLFYKILAVIIFSTLGFIKLTDVQLMRELFVLNIEEYWFINVYIFLYLLSPFINILIKNLDKKKYKKLLILLLVIFCIIPFITGNKAFGNTGYSLYHFTFLYLIGGYLRKYPIEKSYIYKIFTKKSYQLTLLFVYVFLALLNYMITKTSDSLLHIDDIFDEILNNFLVMIRMYSNPITTLQSVAFFLLFGTFNFKNKFINKISKLTIGVYLIHDNDFVRRYLYDWLKIDNRYIYSSKFILYIFGCVILIFIVCAIIEALRQFIFKKIYNMKISNNIRNKYYNYLKELKNE